MQDINLKKKIGGKAFWSLKDSNKHGSMDIKSKDLVNRMKLRKMYQESSVGLKSKRKLARK